MGIVRVQKTSPPEPNIQEISKVILVVGGGLTGMTAALDAAEAGSEVVAGREGRRSSAAGSPAPGRTCPRRRRTATSRPPQVAEKARARPGQREDPRHHRREHREDRRGARPLRRDREDRRRRGDDPRRRDRAGHRRAPLRRLEARAPRLRQHARTSSPRADLEAMAAKGEIVRPSDRKKAKSVALHPVRRLARREPPALLLGRPAARPRSSRRCTSASATPTPRSPSSTATCARPARTSTSTSAPRRTRASS